MAAGGGDVALPGGLLLVEPRRASSWPPPSRAESASAAYSTTVVAQPTHGAVAAQPGKLPGRLAVVMQPHRPPHALAGGQVWVIVVVFTALWRLGAALE